MGQALVDCETRYVLHFKKRPLNRNKLMTLQIQFGCVRCIMLYDSDFLFISMWPMRPVTSLGEGGFSQNSEHAYY